MEQPIAALLLASLVGALYVMGVVHLQRRGDFWSLTRTACMLAGVACATVALVPPMATYDEQFPVHVWQHLLLGMAAPALLALSAPVTLALRVLPSRVRQRLVQVLHSRAVGVVSAPATAVVVNGTGLYALYLTGLYARAEEWPLLHVAVHAHMFAAGCLLAWAVVGIDPVRRRRSVATRLATLVAAAALHDTLAKLIYAHGLPAAGGTPADRHAGAQLMYYGGTAVDLALAVVVMAQWYAATGRQLARRTAPARGAPA